MLLLIWAHLNADAQNNSLAANAEKQGLYSLNIFAGGGASYYLSEPGKAAGIKSEVSRLHAAGTLRIMWHPDHLLRIGLETGIADFYSSKFQDSLSGGVTIQAVPLLLVFSMPIIKRINVFLGTGGYFINSKLAFGGHVESGTFSLGWMAAGSYEYPINANLGIAGEIKLLEAFETRDVLLTAQIQLRWKFMEW
jgi:hypothetical protein